jgi:hypothetical protein
MWIGEIKKKKNCAWVGIEEIMGFRENPNTHYISHIFHRKEWHEWDVYKNVA